MLRKVAFACIALVAIGGLALGGLILGGSIIRGAELRDVLATAKSIEAFEYSSTVLSSTPTVYSNQLSAKVLSKQEIDTIIKAFAGVGFLDSGKACDFEPHHCLVCTMGDGRKREIHICFKCGDIRIDNDRPFDMNPWKSALEQAFVRCGIPVRPELYRWE